MMWSLLYVGQFDYMLLSYNDWTMQFFAPGDHVVKIILYISAALAVAPDL